MNFLNVYQRLEVLTRNLPFGDVRQDVKLIKEIKDVPYNL